MSLPGPDARSTPVERDMHPASRLAPAPDTDRILIVGAGGFGREVLQWARDAWPGQADRIAGFLSVDEHALDGFDCGLGIVEVPEHYRPRRGDRLLMAIGVPYVRRRVAESLLAKGAEFLTLVHPRAVVAASARVGAGAVLCPCAVVSDSCRVGRFVIVNYHASLGHDAVAGDFAVLSPYATLGGQARVGDDVFLGLHASVGPRTTVGARSKVSANSVALHDVPADTLVAGVPGRLFPRIDLA